MASVAAGLVDPTKAGRYPVVLSDALLGKASKEIYTGVRYNHKPDEPPSFAKLKPSPSSNTSHSYDLSYKEDDGIHKYQGVRTSEDGKYVLIFDPTREVFVLHRVDSTFNLNLIRTPSNNDADSLRQEFPHLPNSSVQASSSTSKNSGKSKERAKGSGPLTMPSAKPKSKPEPKKRSQPSDGEEDSDDDDDGGLVMEFPGGRAPPPNRDFSPAFPPRAFSDFLRNAGEEDEEDADAEAEDEEEEMFENFKLPSPVNHQPAPAPPEVPQREAQGMTIAFTFEEDEDEDDDDDDGNNAHHAADANSNADEEMDIDVDDLEAELEAELEQGMESDVSEED